MTTTDPPTGPQGRRPPLSRLVGRRPNQGAAVAAKTVVDDFQALFRAEVALAKAEIAEGVKAKAMSAGLFIGVAIIGWLAIQVFLVFLGFLFALFLPAWAAVGLVLLLLVLAMAGLGYVGLRKFKTETNLRVTKETVEESKSATKDAVDQVKQGAKAGVEEAKGELSDAAAEVRTRIDEWRGATPSTTPGRTSTAVPQTALPETPEAQIPAITRPHPGMAPTGTPAPPAPPAATAGPSLAKPTTTPATTPTTTPEGPQA